MIQKTWELEGKEIFFETGRMAKQADGSVLVGQEGTVVLVTAVSSKDAVTDRDWFPLFVEYRAKFYAAGKIPGGFFKREGRPSEKEIIGARMIDRPIRPLFPDGYMYEVQVAASILSSDTEHKSDILGITGASLALNLSDIPFDGLLSGIRVGMIEDRFILNPTTEEIRDGKIDLVLAGTDDAIVMVEGGAAEVSEQTVAEALEWGHDKIRKINAFQREFLSMCDVPAKREFTPVGRDQELERKVRERYTSEVASRISIKGKLVRGRALAELAKEAVEQFAEEYPEGGKIVKAVLGDIEKELVRRMIVEDGVRTDGRRHDEIREITCEVGVLPRTHGSALFTRGETQSLVVTTLGTSSDEQKIDDLEEDSWKNYMLHYNFPPFSVGEVGFFRGPGRREIGHGVLAERAIRPMIPADEDFPYTIRIVSDVLESNGSSSMATVCGGSLALMDAGVPVGKAVSGVAMGLVKEGDRYVVLTDILGLEDHLGDMDFKVTGTREGITAFQMDCKVAGVDRRVMEQALEQARQARMKILDCMEATIPTARKEISPYAPKITQIKIDVDKIREVIGPGGKVIRAIQEESGAKIDIEDDGTVTIAAVDTAAADKALEIIRQIIAEPELNAVYKGTVKSILPFGAFVEILPGKDGLLHISEIDTKRVEKVEDYFQVGDEVEVKVVRIDNDGKVRLSRKVLL